MTKPKPKDDEPRTFMMPPGYILLDASRARGGVAYKREALGEHRRGEGSLSEYRTRRSVDNAEAVALVDSVYRKVETVMRRHAVNTALGWWVDDLGLARIQAEVHTLKVEAATANRAAELAGSERRVRISVVHTRLDSSPEILEEIGLTIRKNALHAPLLRSRNLERLVVGDAREALEAALARVPKARAEIVRAVKVGRSPQAAGKALDLSAIEDAIAWFGGEGEE
jgi:hypothetical protein